MKHYKLLRYNLTDCDNGNLIRSMYENTRGGVLYVSDFSTGFGCKEYVYRCLMRWNIADRNCAIHELANTIPDNEPKGILINEVKSRKLRLKKLTDLNAPEILIANESKLLLIAAVLNRYAVDIEMLRMPNVTEE